MCSSEDPLLDRFHYVIIWKSPSGCPQSTNPPPRTRSSHLSAVLNGPWEFLATTWLALLQGTLWAAWKHASTLVHEHVNDSSINHKEVWKGNWKWQALSSDLILSNCLSGSVFANRNTEIVSACCWLAQKFNPAVCSRKQALFYLVSVTHSQKTVWIFRPESKPSCLAVCFHPAVEAFMEHRVGNNTQL